MRLKETVTVCVTCGRPVLWMAQHRECWHREASHAKAIKPDSRSLAPGIREEEKRRAFAAAAAR